MTDTPGLCPRCGSGGYGCYECTPTTYTKADLEAHIGAVLELVLHHAIEAGNKAGDTIHESGRIKSPEAASGYTSGSIIAALSVLRPDTMQALERAKREARVEEMRRVKALVEDCMWAEPEGEAFSFDLQDFNTRFEALIAEERGEGE